MINVKRLRGLIGWLAVLLPFIVAILYIVVSGHSRIPDSISETYYDAAAITPFMIILGAASFLLFSYKGYDKVDDIITSLAGLFGLFICLFPCYYGYFNYEGKWTIPETVGTFGTPINISSTVHNLSAGVFFCLLIYMSLFQFTKSDGNRSPNKKKRDIIYIICGVGMLLAIIIWGITNLIEKVSGTYLWGSTWVIEAIALVFFGISWLTKSNVYKWLFADRD